MRGSRDIMTLEEEACLQKVTARRVGPEWTPTLRLGRKAEECRTGVEGTRRNRLPSAAAAAATASPSHPENPNPSAVPACHRCASPAVGVVALAELDEGRGSDFVAGLALCVEHLGDVAEACGFVRPGELRTAGA